MLPRLLSGSPEAVQHRALVFMGCLAGWTRCLMPMAVARAEDADDTRGPGAVAQLGGMHADALDKGTVGRQEAANLVEGRRRSAWPPRRRFYEQGLAGRDLPSQAALCDHMNPWVQRAALQGVSVAPQDERGLRIRHEEVERVVRTRVDRAHHVVHRRWGVPVTERGKDELAPRPTTRVSRRQPHHPIGDRGDDPSVVDPEPGSTCFEVYRREDLSPVPLVQSRRRGGPAEHLVAVGGEKERLVFPQPRGDDEGTHRFLGVVGQTTLGAVAHGAVTTVHAEENRRLFLEDLAVARLTHV